MLTSFYSANPVCSASRAALMTGCYPRRVLEKKTVLFPRDNVGLHPEETTIADVLKTKGYATACVGKWHLGHHPEFLPTAQGFDSYFGIPYSNDMSHPAGAKRPAYGKWDLHWSKPDKSTDWKTPLIENEKILEHPVDQRTITRRYTDRAISFIESNKQNPFFLYLAHSMPHVPLYLPDELYNPDPKRAYISVIEHIDAEVGRRLDPRLVTHETGNSGIRGQSVAIAESDPVLDRRALRSDRAHDRQERQIEADDSIFRVVDDPGDLIGRQPRIDGVQHASTAANPVVQLEMSIAVPGQSRYPLAAAYTQ